MNDDWRVQVDLHDQGRVEPLLAKMEAKELEHDLSVAFEDRVIVSRDGETIFLYAGTREQAEKALQLVRRLDAEDDEWAADTELKRRHPAAEDCEAADRGYPDFEVRIDLPSRQAAGELADRLDAEGMPTVHRWKYVLVGAADEDSAEKLADRIRGEAPPGSRVKVEGTWLSMVADYQRQNPLSLLFGI